MTEFTSYIDENDKYNQIITNSDLNIVHIYVYVSPMSNKYDHTIKIELFPREPSIL